MEKMESVEYLEYLENEDKTPSIMRVCTGYHAGIYGVSCRYLWGIMGVLAGKLEVVGC